MIMEAVEAMTQSERAVTGVCRDPEDDRILGCALAGEADYLVTGDEDLLVMKQFKAISEKKRISVSELIRRVLDQWLERQ